MHTHARGPAAGWSWLVQAINLGRRNPRAVFGAVALLALAALVPSLLQAALRPVFGADATAMMSVMAGSTLVMVVVYPLLIGGMLRVIDDAENGRPTHATAVFDAFRPGNGRGRLVGLGVVLFIAYLVVFVAVVMAFGQDFFGWYIELVTASSQNDQAAAARLMQEIPEGSGRLMALGTLAGLFFSGVYAIGFGQVALHGRGVGAALADGVTGTLKNVLPILVLAVLGFCAFLVLALVVVLVGALLVAVGGLVHPVLAAALVAPVYLGMLLVMYVVMFGVMYFMWRDVCGEAPLPPPGHIAL